jgi:hypothetical protein
MNEQEIENDRLKSSGLKPMSANAIKIPIEFSGDLPPEHPIKIQSNPPMAHSSVASEKPLVTALFQFAAHAEDLYSMPAFGHAPTTGGNVIAERMLDAEKLEAILKALAGKKKPMARRIFARPLEKTKSAH